jgi:hypothetical protein
MTIAINLGHPYIPLEPPPRLLVACVYGVPQSVPHSPGTCSCSASPTAGTASSGQDGEASRALVRVLVDGETHDRPVSWQDVADQTGLSRSRAHALLREERTRLATGNGHQLSLDDPAS